MRREGSRLATICVASVVALSSSWAGAQVRAGSEFRVNTYTSDAQRAPAVAREPDGDFVVVWNAWGHTGDADEYGIFGQRYDASGAPRGGEFQVNTYTTGWQYNPSVAADAQGRFVVVWSTYYATPDGSGYAVHGQRFAADGARLGGEFLVNTTTTGNQYWGRVSVNRSGDFVVVWHSEQLSTNDTEVVAQRFDRTGQRVGGEFIINETTAGFQAFPDVKVSNPGAFVVAWVAPDASAYGIWGRFFNSQGSPNGPEFQVNTYTTGYQEYPSVHGTRTGNTAMPLVVVWQSLGQDGSGYGVFGRRFSAGTGQPLGAEFQVNTYTTNFQSGRPIAAMDEGGNFVVSWRTLAPQDGSGYAAMARRFLANGTPRSPELIVNTYTTGFQDMAHVDTDPAGNFAIVWRSFGQDGDRSGVFGQRFGGLHPHALAVDAAANRVLDPGESATVAPSWQNLNGAAQTFGGGLANITGPTGCTQAIVDGTATYGTVANGATATCTDCYVVSAGPTRCQQHWDIRTIETLTPDNQGQAKEWMLHVGESFTDVPRTSAFHRFVETLFHHGVTGGCNATDYCPSSSTTREQMPVFVLVAKEASGWGPQPCVPPNTFPDVPETSPFCRWIEELERRGVVGGCGGGNYCPSDPVTREQMPVFVLRTLDPAINPPACVPGAEMFDDVPAASVFCRWIEELARRGVVTGCSTNPSLYCPSDPVTREQMGVFISVTFGLSLYGP